MLRYYRIIWIRNDLPAGLSVFFVALPLCLGIALASGAPLYAGLLSGIIGGMVVSLLSGSQLAVSGPAAGLTTVVSASIISLGDYKVFLLAVIVAGVFQLILGILKLGVIANYFPSSVIKGMLAAIGIILISKQIPIALGYDQPDFWTSGIVGLFRKYRFPGHIETFGSHFTAGAILIALISIFIMVIMQRPSAKKLKIIPAPLVVVLAGTLGNFAFTRMAPDLALKQSQLVNIPANIFSDISFPDFSKLFSVAEIGKDGVIIGLLATLETLLCIEAIDKLDRRNRITPVNRELVAQGVGNITCGLLGAIPITAVVVRGAANVDAGGRTKLSAFTHGLFLLLAVVLFPFLLNKIPYASLAAILLITGYNLTKPKLYRNMWSLGLKQFIPFMITVSVIVFTDLLIGVSIGLLISVYYIIRNNFKAEYKITETSRGEAGSYLIKLNTNVTFLNKANLKKTLDDVPDNAVLTIDGSECNFIDYDILEIVGEYENKAKERKIKLILKGIERVNLIAVH
ncbi:MAG: SulP family inorganic anion transporter [Flavihumibacter sp.]